MHTATVRIPEDKRDILKIIAGIEKRDIGKIRVIKEQLPVWTK
jgi:hypothetical protein